MPKPKIVTAGDVTYVGTNAAIESGRRELPEPIPAVAEVKDAEGKVVTPFQPERTYTDDDEDRVWYVSRKVDVSADPDTTATDRWDPAGEYDTRDEAISAALEFAVG